MWIEAFQRWIFKWATTYSEKKGFKKFVLEKMRIYFRYYIYGAHFFQKLSILFVLINMINWKFLITWNMINWKFLLLKRLLSGEIKDLASCTSEIYCSPHQALLDSISYDSNDPERNNVKISIKVVSLGSKILQIILPNLVVNAFYFQRYAMQIIKNKYRAFLNF